MNSKLDLHALSSQLTNGWVSNDPETLKNYGKDWIKDYTPNASAVVFPTDYIEVQNILKFCNEQNIKIVPSGGRTGLSGGATATNGEVILSLDRLNKIIEVNKIDNTIVCQAGATTQQVQESAEANGRYFPVDFASKGSSQIGGNVATNAGGIRVIRYGNMRDWVIGLKAITASGEMLELNGNLYKNQTGYDLRSLLVGSEGTLAVIVEVTLKLVAKPAELIRIICGLESVDNILLLLSETRQRFKSLSAFEYFSRLCLEKVLSHHNLRDPLTEHCQQYALIEIEDEETSLRSKVEEFFFAQIESGLVQDTIISQSIKQSNDFMNYRELIPETINTTRVPHKNDISLPVSSLADFLKLLDEKLSCNYPGFETAIFGHVGDGNLHVNILKPETMTNEKFFELCKAADNDVYSLVKQFKGSISAEHGVGLLKKDYLSYSRSENQIKLMKAIKTALDPNHILNPGKIF